jgi:hypothetical protein
MNSYKGLKAYKSFPVKAKARDDGKCRFVDFPTGRLNLYSSSKELG